MKVSFWISRKLRLSNSRVTRVSTGAFIAICGVALALAVMEVTLAVVTGFKGKISEKVIGFDSEITIGTPYDYMTGIESEYVTLSAELEQAIAEVTDVKPSKSLFVPAMIKTNDDFAGVVIVGYDDAHDYCFERENIIEGVLPDFFNEENQNQIVISETTARSLNLGVGDKVYVSFFADGNMKMRNLNIAGIYESNLGEFDKTIIYGSLTELQHLLGLDSQNASRIELRGFEYDKIGHMARSIETTLSYMAQTGKLDKIYPVYTVFQTSAQYFNWLSLLDTNVLVIFILMLCVGCFTLVSSLYWLVLDKITLIGLLRAIGASRSIVTAVFINLGLRLIAIGMIVGNIIGLGLCLLQDKYQFIKLDPQMYYLKSVPIDIDLVGFMVLNVGVAFISWLVLYVPSRWASMVSPTQSLRFD